MREFERKNAQRQMCHRYAERKKIRSHMNASKDIVLSSDKPSENCFLIHLFTHAFLANLPRVFRACYFRRAAKPPRIAARHNRTFPARRYEKIWVVAIWNFAPSRRLVRTRRAEGHLRKVPRSKHEGSSSGIGRYNGFPDRLTVLTERP